jgi:GT2 family glycosyltransferase
VIYVDSGSTDGSVAAARDAGATVVALDLSQPFTAARARNTGVAALPDSAGFIQFVDGDCRVAPGWLATARAAFADDPGLGIVTGWRREMYPGASVYNAMCEVEWHRPAGEIATCGGDMMVRRAAFEGVHGFNPKVIAAEDDEFCLRVGKAGWTLRRLPETMTHHDAAMTRFGQWWKRAERAGHGFVQVGAMHPGHFRREMRRVRLFGGLLPLLALAGLIWAGWLLLPVAVLYLLSYGRTVRGLAGEGLPLAQALHHGLFLTLSKFPNLIGMARYRWRKARGRAMTLIEYK